MNIRTTCTAEEIRNAQQILPYAEFVGMFSDSKINNGQELPLFKSAPPKNRPGINTLEGWNALCKKNNTKVFIDIFGREPSCDAELRAWYDSHFSSDFRWEGC